MSVEFNTILQELINNGTVSPIISQIQASSVIVSGNKIRTEYKEDDCGVIPFRVAENGAGNISQRPISGSFYTGLDSSPEQGATETRENTRHRILPGNLPITDNRLLHLEASNSNITAPDGGPFTAWLDISGEGNHVLQSVGSRQPSLVKTNASEYNSVIFDGESKWLELATPPAALQTLVDKTIYITAKLNDNSGATTEGQGIELSASSTSQTLDVFHSYAVVNETGAVKIFGATSKNSTMDILSSSAGAGEDIAFLADGDLVTNTELSELIIYSDLHTDEQVANNLGYMLCKHLSSPVE